MALYFYLLFFHCLSPLLYYRTYFRFQLHDQTLTYYTVSSDGTKGALRGKCVISRFSKLEVYPDDWEVGGRPRSSTFEGRMSDVSNEREVKLHLDKCIKLLCFLYDHYFNKQ